MKVSIFTILYLVGLAVFVFGVIIRDRLYHRAQSKAGSDIPAKEEQ